MFLEVISGCFPVVCLNHEYACGFCSWSAAFLSLTINVEHENYTHSFENLAHKNSEFGWYFLFIFIIF